MVGFAFAAASATLVGQNLGAKKIARAEKSAWEAVAFFEIILTALLLLFISFPEGIIRIFSEEEGVIEIGGEYVSLLGIALPFLGLSVVLSRAFGGAGETRLPMIVTAIALIGVRIPLSYYLASFMGVSGIWYGLLASNLIEGTIIALLFRRGSWKKAKLDV